MGIANVVRHTSAARAMLRQQPAYWSRHAIVGRMPLVVPNATLALFSDLGVTVNDEAIAQPDAFDTWSLSGCTASANSTTDPLGGTAADSIIEDSSNGLHFVSRTATNRQAGVPETWTVYAKAGTRSWMSLGDNSGGSWSWFNLSTGAMGTQAGLTARSIYDAGNGWWRLSVTATGFSGVFSIFLGTADNTFSYQGNGTGNIFLFRAGASCPRASAWGDQTTSANNASQGAGGAQPFITTASNLLPELKFDGTDDTLATAAFARTQPVDTVLGVKFNTIGASAAHDVLESGLTDNTTAFYQDTTPQYLIASGANLAVGANIANGTYAVWRGLFNGASSEMGVNGTVTASGAAGATNGSGWRFGGLAASRWASVSLQMAFEYSRSLSAIETRTLEYWTMHRLGILA